MLDWGDIFPWMNPATNWLAAWIQALADWTYEVMQWLYRQIVWVWEQVQKLWPWLRDGIKWLASAVWRGLTALGHLNFRKIWEKIHKAYERLQKATEWYRRRIIGPIDLLRHHIWQIYRTFFAPLLRVVDTVRMMTRTLAIFNRKLAARLDSRLLRLEGKLMWPITAMLRRVNEMASFQRAIFTASGRLSRAIMLETLRRDCLLVWGTLTNPRRRIFEPVPPLPGIPFTQTVEEARLYLATGGGPLAEEMDALLKEAHDLLAEVS